jgi:hypothetical protein
MFIYSDARPPAKADLHIHIYFQELAPMVKDLQMSARGLVIRVEQATGARSVEGFAILNRSYDLREGADWAPE